jgi:hypothetical protein
VRRHARRKFVSTYTAHERMYWGMRSSGRVTIGRLLIAGGWSPCSWAFMIAHDGGFGLLVRVKRGALSVRVGR